MACPGPCPRPCRALIGSTVAVLVVVLTMLSPGQVQGRIVPRALSIDADCPLYKQVREYMSIDNVTFGQFPNGDHHFSFVLRYFKRPYKFHKVNFNITTCPFTATSKTHPKCTTFGHWKFDKNVCQLSKARNTLWTRAMDAATPPPPASCRPLGVYTVREATIDVKLLEALRPPVGHLWFVEILTWDTRGNAVFCMNLKGSVQSA